MAAPGPANRPAGVVAAEQQRRQVEHVAIDQSGLVQIVGQPGAALHQQLEHPALAQVVEHPTERPAQLQGRMHLGVRRRAAQHHPQRLHEPGRQLLVGQPHGERGVVESHGAGAHGDGVAVGPQAVGVVSGLVTGDPLAGAVRGGRAAVEAGRQLEDDQRSPGAAMVQIGRQLLGHRDRGRLQARGLGGHLDGQPGGSQAVDPAAGHSVVGVTDPDHHPGHPGLDGGIGTGAGPLSGMGSRARG